MQETKETQSGGGKVRAVFNDFLTMYDDTTVRSDFPEKRRQGEEVCTTVVETPLRSKI